MGVQIVIEFMKDLARRAGSYAREARKRLDDSMISTKQSPMDLVTVVDREVEELVVGEIRARFPDHGFWGEEGGQVNAEARWQWLIDPIDGTTSYIHGYPFYCVSLGLREAGRPQAGAVYLPALDELFWAERGGGAWLNGTRIKVSARAQLSEALLATGFACIRARQDRNNLPRFNRLVPQIQGIRRSGSAAVDLAYVACGRLEGYWEDGVKPYDVAAGALLVEEAGGRVADLTGGERYPDLGIVASNAALHERLVAALRE